MTAATSSLEQLAINTIRTLSMDAVQKANSGHPGTPMALAPVAYWLFNHEMNYNPAQPLWPARDRFVLSCGHASMLLYSMIHLSQIKATDHSGKVLDKPSLTLEDLKNFRQLHSPCAGHPEYGYAAGIEMTTGPLGQGVATSIGMALAAKWYAARYNRPGFELFDFNTFVLCSDGDLMEGVSSEAASIAGHLKLSNLCWIYDDNKITIEGETELAFTENVGKKFEAMGWRTVEVTDANDLAAIQKSIKTYRDTDDRPTLVVLKSIIGYGAPNKQNSHAAHGAPLGEDEIKLAKQFYGWPADQHFLVPDEVKKHFQDGIGARGAAAYANWQARFAEYKKEYPTEAKELEDIWNHRLPAGWDKDIPVFPADPKGLATRVSSGKVLNGIAKNLPWLVGGSADLAPSTMTLLNAEKDFDHHNYAGRNLHYGIREHGMAALCNGMSLSGLKAFGATFFVFSDYLRPALRLGSIMHQPVIQVLTHDSIGLGEDGPTHQPVEHLAACRAIPGVYVFRPSDANEVSESYRVALQNLRHPCVMVLTRQNVPTLDRNNFGGVSGVAKGAYVLAGDPKEKPQVILVASGSEVPIAMEAHQKLVAEGVKSRLVSMVSFELFEEQDAAYRNSVLPPDVTARVGVEAGIRQGWDRYIGTQGEFVGMTGFGLSGPFQKLYDHFGITSGKVYEAAKKQLATK